MVSVNYIDFQARFGADEQCRKHLFNQRWGDGFVCPKCGHTEYFDIKSRNLYQCKSCGHQASVTAGTIMDKTRTPLSKWFLAIYLMAEDKRGISTLALSKKIGVAYNTAWTISHKVKWAMGKRDDSYKMDGVVEIDESFFGSSSEGGKRGRGTDKTAVMVGVSLTEDGKPLFAKMEVLNAVNSEAVDKFTSSNVKIGSVIRTDGLNIYTHLSNNGYKLEQKLYSPKEQPEHLHWIHIVLSNAKAFIEGTYHGLDKVHLQRYLDEFCYRFNRRHFKSGVFSRMLKLCSLSGKIVGHELIG